MENSNLKILYYCISIFIIAVVSILIFSILSPVVYLLIYLPPIVFIGTIISCYAICLKEKINSIITIFVPILLHIILSVMPFISNLYSAFEYKGTIIQSFIISYIFTEMIIQGFRIIDKEINVLEVMDSEHVKRILKRSIIMSAAIAAIYSLMLPFALYGLFSLYGISYSSFISVLESNGIGVILFIYILIAVEILISYYNASMLGRKYIVRHTISFNLVFLTVFSALACLII